VSRLLPPPRSVTVPATHPAAELPALLPWLWTDDIGGVYRSVSGVPLFVTVRGIVKPPEGLPSAEGVTDQRTVYLMARQVREHYARFAEAAISAVEAAGWRHEQHPDLLISGSVVRGRRGTGEPDILRAEAHLMMGLAREGW
jgi:hypothetical protein